MAFIEPDKEQILAFASQPDTGPVVMVNLLRYRPDGGRERYEEYAQAVIPLIAKAGGRLVFRANAAASVIGDEEWDEVILVEYPSRKAFGEMIASEAYGAIAHLRTEALVDSRLHPTFPD